MSFAMGNRRPLSRYRPPPHRSLRPLPPRWAAHEEVTARSPLAQFIVLSMLLHALAIMLFGAPAGGSREGRAMWGSLDVVIRGPLREEKASPPKQLAAPRPRATPGKEAVIPAKKPIPEKKPVIPEKPAVIPGSSTEAGAGNPSIPPLLAIPPKAAPAIPPAFEVPPLPEPEPAPAPAKPPPAPISEMPAVQLPALPRLEQAAPLPVDPLPVPQPAPAPQREIAPVELDALPRMVVPTLPAIPVEALPRMEVPTLPALPVETLPSLIERVEAPPAPPALEPPMAQPPQAELPRAEPPRVETTRRVEPFIEPPALRESPFRPSPSATRVGPGRGEPPSDYDPTAAPSLDAEALRRRAGEIARQGSGQRAVLAFPMPPIPERKTKLEEAIEKARKPDCRTAYQNLGLAAVFPLIANEFGEGSCRW